MEPTPLFLWLPILLPLLAAVGIVLFVPRDEEGAVRGATLTITLVTFLLSLPLFFLFDPAGPTFQFDRAGPIQVPLLNITLPWLSHFGANFHLGIDGISLCLIVLTTFLMPISVLASWRGITTRVKDFHVALLVLEGAMVGVFAARDLLVFFLFWEVMLIPMFLLIGIWGADERIKAAIKFFIYTAVGSLLMLAAIAYVYVLAGYSFDMVVIERELATLRESGALAPSTQFWLCLAFAIAFAIKVPIFPFHTWLPHAHVQAPTAGSVILAAVLLKMGGYGFIRFCLPLFPQGLTFEPSLVILDLPSLASVLTWLGVIGVIYGALMALAQKDLKRLVAYSSISHLGLVVIGIFASLTSPEGQAFVAGNLESTEAFQSGHIRALTGSTYQMIAHGLSTGALFFLVGCIYDRRHTKLIGDLGGVAKSAPRLATCFVLASLASIALPTTAGFVGEILILIGVYESRPMFAILGVTGMILGAVYMLWAVQRVFFGPATGANREVEDINAVELCGVVPLLAFTFVLGLCPGPFLDRIEPAVKALVSAYGG